MANTRDPAGWMWTHSGKQYWPLDPRAEDVCIEDIARGQSMQCRYAGQVQYYYSTAEHSVLVSLMVPPELALEGLLHDAAEAYCSDIVRPFKKGLPDYKAYEGLNDLAIRSRFRLPPKEHRLVKQADSNILHTEYRTIMRHPLPESCWKDVPGTYDPTVRLFLWSPASAEIAFLNRFAALMKASGIRNS
jgi:hypothetical protein